MSAQGDRTPDIKPSSVDAARRYGLMVREAQSKRLNESPPYSTEQARTAWQSGYLAALHDIANGYFNAR